MLFWTFLLWRYDFLTWYSCLQLRDLGVSLIELWNLMDTPLEDQQSFQHITCNIAVTEEDITLPGSLALGIIDQAEIEVARLDTLKASKMKELVVKRRMELEEVCRCAHIEPDASTMEDKLIALIDSGDLELPCLSQGFSITVLFFSYCIC
jgi:protein regulator of cytokinesis 1